MTQSWKLGNITKTLFKSARYTLCSIKKIFPMKEMKIPTLNNP